MEKHDDGAKTPHYITRVDCDPLYFADLRAHWTDGDTVLESCTILTTAANEQMKPVHCWMPCILEPEQVESWSDPDEQNHDTISAFLKPAPEGLLAMYGVHPREGNTRNNDNTLIEPVIGAISTSRRSSMHDRATNDETLWTGNQQ